MWSDDPELEEAVRASLRSGARYWTLPELAAFALSGHGFGESDGGFGITYPGDCDDYERALGQDFAPGYVRAYEFFGPPNGREWLVPEPLYLAVLAEMLDAAGFTADAARVRAKALVGE
jgi:hypothetical protein